MENKYYTPQIEEFYVGFEYEVQCIDNAQWGIAICGQGFGSFDDDIDDLEEGRIRVKYLDREDVESLGFKEDKERTSLPTITHYGKNNLSLTYETDNRLTIVKHNDINTREICFTGYIKNKSELIKILKQPNIT